MRGPYDVGYASCPCFWGREPGSLILELRRHVATLHGLRILDAGCGEGKNAVFLSRLGAIVRAIDSSELALANARTAWPDEKNIVWELGDVSNLSALRDQYDIVIAYGLLHCLPTETELRQMIDSFKAATVPGGFNVICAFN